MLFIKRTFRIIEMELEIPGFWPLLFVYIFSAKQLLLLFPYSVIVLLFTDINKNSLSVISLKM